MESEAALVVGRQPSTKDRVLVAVGSLLWVAISYVDPGKWAAALEGGAQLGSNLILLLLVINFVAILFQYLSARITIATGRNLAKICSEEYNSTLCVLLGIQAEMSMIMLDLTTVLGTAYGLNAVFGINLVNCVFLTGCDAILFPIFSNLLGNTKARIFSVCLVCFILASCVPRVVMSQPEHSFSVSRIINILTGENAYTLMGILGANMMPHNFYLHSSAVQQNQRLTKVSKGKLFHDHLLANFCVFSGIFLFNCMLINLAASDLTSLTLQDAVSLLDQEYRSLLPSVALIFILFLSNQLVAATWGLEKQVIANDFFGSEIPGWHHCITIRIIAIVLALFCVWNSGAEGVFQVLIFAQVMVALLLPSSLFPLFRIASSRSMMGANKISHPVEFLALLSFLGILGLNILFIIELIFGSSDWVTNLKWNVGTGVPVLYHILLVATFASLTLMLWLAITPLKSASSGADTHALKWDERAVMSGTSIGDEAETKEIREPVSSLEKSFGNQLNLSCSSPEPNLPKQLLDTEKNRHLIRSSDDKPDAAFPTLAEGSPSYAIAPEISLPESIEVKRNELVDNHVESHDLVEKTLKIEGDGQVEKANRRDPWGPEEVRKDISESGQCFTSEGPGSFKSLNGKLDDMGSGTGSLSRLGRAARRQLAFVLDEFWGQMFNSHGLVTAEAKVKRLDVLLGIESQADSKSSSVSVKSENISKELARYYPSVADSKSSTLSVKSENIRKELARFYPYVASGRGSDARNSTFYTPAVQHVGQGTIGLSPGVQPGSPRSSNHTQLLNSYVSGNGGLESGERRYRSMHVHAPSSTEGNEKQPVTIHSFNMASYLGRLAQEKGPDYSKSQLGSFTSTPSTKPNNVDSSSRPVGQKPQNGLRVPPGFHNVPIYRNSSMRLERPLNDLSSHEPMDYGNSPPGEKKFHSLPNISGLYNIPQGYYGQSIGRPIPEQTTSRPNLSVGFSPHSPSKVCRGAFSFQFNSNSGAGSLWSKHQYEQFGVVADKPPSEAQEAPSFMDMEVKLLQSLRSSIVKLLNLEGSIWLFRQNDGADEDLIDRIAARERFLHEIENMTADRNLGSATKRDEMDHSKFMSVPNCGDGCVWRVDLVVSFGVWCIHRVLELSLVESRPELWGKYTYVLNRLQGIIELAFSKNRTPTGPCFCLQLPVGYQQKTSFPVSNSSLPPQSKVGRGKVTTAPMLLDLIKDVELAISCRKGRSGTAAGDVAFPKGKENIASVLKRYKRRLANKPVGPHQEARKNGASPPPPGL